MVLEESSVRSLTVINNWLNKTIDTTNSIKTNQNHNHPYEPKLQPTSSSLLTHSSLSNPPVLENSVEGRKNLVSKLISLDVFLEAYLKDFHLDLPLHLQSLYSQKLEDAASVSHQNQNQHQHPYEQQQGQEGGHGQGQGQENLETKELCQVLSWELSLWKLVSIFCSEASTSVPLKNELEEESVKSGSTHPRSVNNKEMEMTGVTDHGKVQELFNRDIKLLEAGNVRTWLEKLLPELDPFQPKTHSNDLTEVKESLGSNKNNHNLVDPFTLTSNFELNRAQQHLLKHIYLLIRRGKILEAMDLASMNGLSTLAASFRGGIYFHDPKLDLEEVGLDLDGELNECSDPGYNSNPNYNLEEEEEGPTMDLSCPSGNLNRRLWRATAFALARGSTFKYERAIYAVLCGDLQTVLECCDGWYDYLWAYFSCTIESQVDQFLSGNPSILNASEEEDLSDLPQPPTLDLDASKIFQRLEQSSDANLANLANNFYPQLHKHLILHDLPTFFQQIQLQLKLESDSNGKSLVETPFLRLIVQLILYLTTNGLLPYDRVVEDLVVFYIQRLVNLNELRMAILYCSKLQPERQLDLFTEILAGLHGVPAVKLECLRYGTMFDLNFDQVLQKTFEKVLHKVGSQPDSDPNRQADHDVHDLHLAQTQVQAFDWLLHDTSLYAQAILNLNQLVYQHLEMGRIKAAQLLTEAMPPNLILPEWVETEAEALETDPKLYRLHLAAMEYTSYRILLETFKSIETFHTSLARYKARDGMNGSTSGSMLGDFRDFEVEVKKAAKDAEVRIKYLLHSNWFCNLVPSTSNHPLQQDFLELDLNTKAITLRRAYVPQLVYALLDVLVETQGLVKGNLHKALEVVELVGMEEMAIYKDFLNRTSTPNSDPYNDLPNLMHKFYSIASGLDFLPKEPQNGGTSVQQQSTASGMGRNLHKEPNLVTHKGLGKRDRVQ